jgi:hypothetical protein
LLFLVSFRVVERLGAYALCMRFGSNPRKEKNEVQKDRIDYVKKEPKG